jgi:iron complex outermembrane receptor protein
MNKPYCSAAILVATAFSSSAHAQNVRSTSPDVTANSAGITDIVVTARKRTENLRDVPVAITAVSGITLQNKNITQIIDFVKITPNFTYTYAAANSLATIRGIGSGSGAAFDQSVGKFIDNVNYGRDYEARIPIFDVDRIEVLKGPQVLAFGNSATAGAISITTKKPGATLEADGSAGYDLVEHELQAQMGITVPISQGASFRLAGLFQDLSKGRYYNPLKDQHEPNTRGFALRPTLRLNPANGLEITLHAEIDRMKDTGFSFVPIAQPLKASVPRYPAESIINQKSERYVDYYVAPFFSNEQNVLHSELYQADIDYHAIGGTLTSTTAWRHSNNGNQWGFEGVSYQPAFFQAQWTGFHQFSQELRFSGTYGKLDVTAGGYYQRDTQSTDNVAELALGAYGVTGIAATPLSRVTFFDQKQRSWSGFTDLTLHLTDRLSLSAGVRYSDILKQAGQMMFAAGIIPRLDYSTTREQLLATRNPAFDAAFAALGLGTDHSFPLGSLRLSEHHWQPQAIAQYEIAPKNKAYIKYVQGDKAGGFDYLYARNDPSTISFGPEKANMLEVGLKGLILDNRLSYTVAIFHEIFTGLQLSAVPGLVSVVTNAGKARSQGVELEFAYHPDSHWTFGFNGSYLDAKFLDYKNAPCNPTQSANASDATCAGTPRTQDLSGVQTGFSSKWTESLTGDYITKIGSGKHQIGLGATVFARSAYNPSQTVNDPTSKQSGYAQMDAHLDFGAVNGRWNLSVFGRNLSNKEVLEYTVGVPGNNTSVMGSYSRGRELGARLSFAL